ncbi:MAG: stage II sporulation protein P [Bacilli bacterium]|nr:stage II sporulation protein P [Bacilli bacterium]
MSKFTPKKKKKKKYFIKIIILLFIIYQLISIIPIKLNTPFLASFVLRNTYQVERESPIIKVVRKSFKSLNPLKKILKEKESKKEETIKEERKPKIYIYNTHPTEEYKASNILELSIQPNVIMNDYILKDLFEEKGYSTIVETTSVKDILNNNHWNYASSYKASRILLEQSILTYPTLEYFIDVHRDSLTRDKTVIEIENKEYAKLLFIVGLENPNYQENLYFTEKIHNKINEKYPNL